MTSEDGYSECILIISADYITGTIVTVKYIDQRKYITVAVLSLHSRAKLSNYNAAFNFH